jgi:hypothetical protein
MGEEQVSPPGLVTSALTRKLTGRDTAIAVLLLTVHFHSAASNTLVVVGKEKHHHGVFMIRKQIKVTHVPFHGWYVRGSLQQASYMWIIIHHARPFSREH